MQDSHGDPWSIGSRRQATFDASPRTRPDHSPSASEASRSKDARSFSAVVARAWISRLVGQLGPVVGVSDSRLGRVEGLHDTDYTAVRTGCAPGALFAACRRRLALLRSGPPRWKAMRF